MGIMAIGLISFKFSPAAATVQDNSDVTASPAPTPTLAPTAVPSPTPVPTPTPVPNTLTKLESDNDIAKLITAYLNAKLSCDREQFADIVSDPSAIDEAYLQQRYEIITSIKDITCYTKKGTGAIDYVVYYTYYSDIVTVPFPGISIDRSFVYKDTEGKWRVYIGDIDDETEEALNALNFDEDVLQLFRDVYAQIEAEAAEDESIISYWKTLPDVEFGIDPGKLDSDPENGETGNDAGNDGSDDSDAGDPSGSVG